MHTCYMFTYIPYSRRVILKRYCYTKEIFICYTSHLVVVSKFQKMTQRNDCQAVLFTCPLICVAAAQVVKQIPHVCPVVPAIQRCKVRKYVSVRPTRIYRPRCPVCWCYYYGRRGWVHWYSWGCISYGSRGAAAWGWRYRRWQWGEMDSYYGAYCKCYYGRLMCWTRR